MSRPLVSLLNHRLWHTGCFTELNDSLRCSGQARNKALCVTAAGDAMSYGTTALLTAAMEIETKGHSRQANARNGHGRACAISDPKAVQFSIYGAVSKALKAGDVELQSGRYRDLWAALTNAATERMFQMGLAPAPSQHPVFALNDVPGFNAAAAADFLREVAERLQTAAETVRNGAAT